MSRYLIALALALVTLGLSPDGAGAKPPGPESCEFVLGFAAFREALGEEIVGDCEDDQDADEHGNVHQRTSWGVLSWEARTNRISFREDARLWLSGPGGLDAETLIDGLGDEWTNHAPLRTRAATVLDLASLDPYALGPGWEWGLSPLMMPRTAQLPCAPPHDDRSLGAIQTWLFHRETGRTVMHALSAEPVWAIAPIRPELERIVAACGDVDEESPRGTYTLRMHVEPFVPLGDESLVMRMEIEHRESGQRIGAEVGYVRYGGLVSMVMGAFDPSRSDEEVRAELEWLAEAAHEYVLDAAWYLAGE